MDWRELLEDYQLVLGLNKYFERPPWTLWAEENQVEVKYPWRSPASQDEIREAERRLGVALPPTYLAFLSQSNGWYGFNDAVCELYPLSKVAWVRDLEHAWIDDYLAAFGDPGPENDGRYLVYGHGAEQYESRPRYLRSALQISPVGDLAAVFLNPEVIHDGEWEAWFFATWMSGALRCKSFADLFEAIVLDGKRALE